MAVGSPPEPIPSSADDAARPTSADAAARFTGERSSLPGAAAYKLEAQGLRASLGATRVLHGIDMGIEAHQVTAIIGPAGAGKTTFLRCLNRMHEVAPGARSEGRVLLDGADIYARGVNPVTIRRRVAMIFQQPNPFVAMSVRENVLAGLTLNGIRVADPNGLVERLLQEVLLWDELKDALDRPSASLSEGQRQRLCVARCLALGPEVILMDDPSAALDPGESAELEDLIARLKAEHTIVIATQDLQQAARVAAKTAFFYKGQLVEHERTPVLFTRPSDQRTEDYITGRVR